MPIAIYRTSSVTAVFDTPQEIVINHVDDSIKIGDGTRLAAITADNALKVASTSVTLTTRIDEVNATTTYIGKANVGTAESAAGWQIQKITTLGALTTFAFADGNENYDNVWNNRSSLSYS